MEETLVPATHFTLANAQELVGRDLGASSWVILDQAMIDAFAECTGDCQWIHVDVERARRESPFGGTIAHGYLTLSLIAPATFELLVEPAGVKQAFNYGLDRVRFVAPARAGARVRVRVKVLSAEDKGGGRLLVTTDNTVEIEGESKPALTAVALAMLIAD
ncbi:MAG TPA: MaoC family dehydratase [Propionibacteriaceae bacterium]|nr:MaoC family dehydratase [Propionibacteriaceae bacterium]